jgi:hypothetical protein
MSEVFFVPTRSAQPVSVTEMQNRFNAEGLPCILEEDSPETCWIVFHPNELTIFASISDGVVSLATVNIGFNDDPSVYSKVERVLGSLGFSADEDADYL